MSRPRPLHALLPCLVLALTACRQSPPLPPEDPHPPEPVVQEDPIAGDPADIEGEELGEDQLDDAKVVEPGPAETAVEKGNSATWPDPS